MGNDRRYELWLPRAVSRRQLIFGAGAAVVAGGLAACGGGDDEASPTTGGAAPDTTGGSTATTGSSATSAPGTAPGTTAGGTPAGTPGGTLRVGLVGSTNDIIDGQYIVAKADQARCVTGWDPVLNYDTDFNISYEHSLAEEVETKAADNYVIRFKEGLEFHNGKPVTGDDIIYSFRRRIDPELNLAPGLAELLGPDGMTAIDDRTIEFQLLKPAVTFVNSLAEYTTTIVPVDYARFDGDVSTQIGTGPFMLQSFTPGTESVHVKNPNYWASGLPYLDEVQIIDFADAQALTNALASGDIDAAVDVPFAQVSTVESDSNLRILESQAGNWLVITMAIDQAPFDDVRVRQAMRLIANRQEMVDRVLVGHGRIANDMYGVLDPCYPADIPQREQDIEQAMALLAEAGQENLTIDLFAPDDTAGLPDLIAVFADQAQAAGVTVNAQVLDGGTYWGDEYTKRTFATSFWSTRPYLIQVAAGSLENAIYPETHWPPPDSDFTEKYEQAIAETDDDARCEVIAEMQQEEYDDGGNLIPFFYNLVDGHAANVQGFEARPNLLNLDHYGRGWKNIWLES
ncbi:MAG: ABC transporter substrate-binding protein [Ilumatobacteraceae bacterium]